MPSVPLSHTEILEGFKRETVQAVNSMTSDRVLESDWPLLESACVFVLVATLLTIGEIAFALLVAIPNIRTQVSHNLDRLSSDLKAKLFEERPPSHVALLQKALHTTGDWVNVIFKAESRLQEQANKQVLIIGGVIVVTLATVTFMLIRNLLGKHHKFNTGKTGVTFAKILWWSLLNLGLIAYFQKGFVEMTMSEWKFVGPDVVVRETVREVDIPTCQRLRTCRDSKDNAIAGAAATQDIVGALASIGATYLPSDLPSDLPSVSDVLPGAPLAALDPALATSLATSLL